MYKRIVFTDLQGNCNIIAPSPNSPRTIEEEAIATVPAGLSYRIINTSELPTDRTYRNAWTDEYPTNTVDVNMVKARVLHMEKIRKARDAKLKVLDVETMKGINVQAAKQILRDLPATVDLSVSTVEELKLLWPVELA